MQKRVIRRRKPLVKESETRPKTTTVLSFNATIISNNTDDQLREFMVNFCIENSSFAVYEKVVPNSGFPGGKFIKESKATSPETGKPYTPDEVHIGATIVVNGWKFKLGKPSEATLKIIESRPETFTMSNMKTIREPFNRRMKGHRDEIEKSFAECDPHNHGKVTRDQLRQILEKNNISLGEQEFLILFRKYQFAGSELFLYKDFLADS